MENSTDIVKVNGESTGGVTTFDYGMRMASLTPEERTHYLEVAKKIDTNDVNSVLRYGNEISSTIAQNGDSRKKVIALAQTYFAIQTRKQELSEKEYSELTEDEKRIYRRKYSKSK